MKYTRTDVFEDVYNNYDDGSDKYTSAKDSKFRDYRSKRLTTRRLPISIKFPHNKL